MFNAISCRIGATIDHVVNVVIEITDTDSTVTAIKAEKTDLTI